MKLIVVQIFAAVTSIGLVGTGGALMHAIAGKNEAQRKVQKLESELKLVRGTTPADGAAKRDGPRDLEKELAEFAARVRTLEQAVGTLERENARLKGELARANAALAAAKAQKPIPGGATPGAAPGTTDVASRDPSGQAPPPPPAPSEEPWGAAEDTEVDEMTAVLKLTSDQREGVRKAILDGQNKFEQLLIALSQQGERDIRKIEEVGEQVSREVQNAIRAQLTADQQSKFDDYMRQKEEMR